jgi:hypothetical protein
MFYKDLFDSYGTIPFTVRPYDECGDKPGAGCGVDAVRIDGWQFNSSNRFFFCVVVV